MNATMLDYSQSVTTSKMIVDVPDLESVQQVPQKLVANSQYLVFKLMIIGSSGID